MEIIDFMLDFREGLRRLSSAVLASLLATVSVILPVSPAEKAVADAPTPFNCEPVFYQISAGFLYEFDPVTVTYTNVNPSSENIARLNAGGYNPADDFIYSFADSSCIGWGATARSLCSTHSLDSPTQQQATSSATIYC